MRLLLDENLDRRLKHFFSEEHEVVTIRERSWGSKENGELIEAAQREFDALITMDQGIPHQHNLRDLDLAIVLLEAPGNRLVDLVPLVEGVKAVLSEARPGEVLCVQGSRQSLWRAFNSIPLRAGLDEGVPEAWKSANPHLCAEPCLQEVVATLWSQL